MDMAVGQAVRPWRGLGQWVDAVTEGRDHRGRDHKRRPAGLGLPAALGGVRAGDAALAADPTRWDDGDDLRSFLTYGAQGTSEAERLRVCGVRWQFEECFAQAKGEVGLDQYEVRT
jgi:hypothetical protein